MPHRNHLAFLTLVLAMVASTSAAQTVVTPTNPHGWGIYTYGTSSPAPYGAVTTTYAHLGNGSAEMRLYDEGTTEVQWWYELQTPTALSSLNKLSFDWFVSSSSTTPAWTTPAFALYLNTGGFLIWEGAYNGTTPAATQDNWVSSDILGDKFWWDHPGVGACGQAASYNTLEWFNTNCFNGTAEVVGFSPFLGFGYSGQEFFGAFDNVAFAFEDGESEQFNFEASADVSTVPEPASMTLLAAGLIAVAGVSRRRKSKG